MTKRKAELFRASLTATGMSIQAFADIVKRDKRTVARWASGKRPIPEYVWVVLNQLPRK